MATGGLHRLSAAETAGVVGDVLAPLVARGLIVRRPRVVDALDRLDADRRLVRRMHRLRERFGPAPVVLGLPLRRIALVLDPQDVRRVLDGTPEPFTAANREKRAALGRFEPHGVLVTRGPEREERRRINEAALEPHRPRHHLADRFAAAVGEEVDALVAGGDALTWARFAPAWWRIVRRVTLGDGARDDVELTESLRRLRAAGNWGPFAPRRRRLGERFATRLRAHLDRAEPGSLAGALAAIPAGPSGDPAGQVPQWLFAFDAAGIALFRTLALLDAHPAALERARADTAPELAFLRACVLEALRLWPTTPGILRDTTAPTTWAGGGTLPQDTAVLIVAPFFHRDADRLPEADRFAPELWLDGRAQADPAIVPFSAGPAGCPGREVVLTVTSLTLARLLAGGALRGASDARLDPAAPLPATLSPFRLRFGLATD